MSRFLITTGDESTWKFDRPVIFLGQWCLSEDRKDVWNSMDYSVVDPGPIQGALPDLFRQTQQLHSQLSLDLISALNSYHGHTFSNRFWNVIVGPWLRSFCDNLVLRWAFLNQAISELDANDSYAELDNTDLLNHPRNFLEYRLSQMSQTWNQYMYSKTWKLMTSPQLPSPPVSKGSALNSSLGRLVDRKHSATSRRVVLTSTYLPRASEAMLTILMGSRPARIRRIIPPSASFSPEVRTQLEFPGAPVSRFHAIGRELVRDQILTVYVEGFPKLLEAVHQLRLPDAPDLIFTSNRHLYDDVFNAWVAKATELGSKYVIGQHGGHYGLSKFPSYSELHEEDISDAYITWGRKDSEKQIPGPCLTTVGRKYRPSSKAKHLLIVCDQLWKYPRSLFFDISENSEYLEYIAKCVTGLPSSIGSDVLIRLNHASAETGMSQIEWWQNRVLKVDVDPGLGSMKNLLRQSRAVVSTCNGTTFLETLNLNIPTLITWDDSYVQLRPEALPYFRNLERVGIFHSNERSFVDHVTKNWDDIETWWNGDVVQAVRLEFCNQFSGLQPHPLLFLRQILHTPNLKNNS